MQKYETMKEHICKCNNCEAYLFDENPGNSIMFDITGDELHMIQIEIEPGEFIWACPECKTDEYLTDIETYPHNITDAGISNEREEMPYQNLLMAIVILSLIAALIIDPVYNI